MTETELVLGSLTPEELDDANQYVAKFIASWKTQSKDERRRIGLDTDGPFHALTALRLAVLREMTLRGGGEPWFVGMPTEGHVAGAVLDLYGRRYGFRDQEARLSRSGVLERVCVICGEPKPQDGAHFERPEGLWSDICRACNRVDPERYRDAIAYSPSPALPVEMDPPPADDQALLELL